MPIDHAHAFGGGRAYPRPTGLFPPLPWSIEARVAKAWSQYLAGSQIGDGCMLGPSAWCVNCSEDRTRIVLKARVVCRGLLRVEQFGSGRIEIGEDSYIGDDCLLSSANSIVIGTRVLIAHGVQIFDNDSHPLDPSARERDFAAILKGGTREPIASGPVRIEAGAWVGFNAIILKGTTIGEGSVVAAGSVVAKDVPAHTVVAGNPAAVLKTLPPA